MSRDRKVSLHISHEIICIFLVGDRVWYLIIEGNIFMIYLSKYLLYRIPSIEQGIVMSLYYYLGVMRKVYFEKPRSEEPIKIALSWRFVLLLSSFAIIFLGFMPFLYTSLVDIADKLLR